jgi:hypothetical protein
MPDVVATVPVGLDLIRGRTPERCEILEIGHNPGIVHSNNNPRNLVRHSIPWHIHDHIFEEARRLSIWDISSGRRRVEANQINRGSIRSGHAARRVHNDMTGIAAGSSD